MIRMRALSNRKTREKSVGRNVETQALEIHGRFYVHPLAIN